jgi:hypothetical protein
MSNKEVLRRLAAATAIGALGYLTVPAIAQAYPMVPLAPACTQYGFDGEFAMRGLGQVGAGGWTVTITSTGSTASGSALAVFDDGGTVYGTVSGGIRGRTVDLTVTWNNKPNNVWTFVGAVEDDGLVHNGGPSYWTSSRPLTCQDLDTKINKLPGGIITAPADPAPQAPPAAPVAARVISDVDVYDAPDGGRTVIGTLYAGTYVLLAEKTCAQNDWCQVTGPNVPTGKGWVWGHLEFI